jgi:hypothetical protein
MQAMQIEVESAQCLIWAMCDSQGGSIKIPDDSMKRATNNAVIESRYDAAKSLTIISSTIKKEGVNDEEQKGDGHSTGGESGDPETPHKENP